MSDIQWGWPAWETQFLGYTLEDDLIREMFLEIYARECPGKPKEPGTDPEKEEFLRNLKEWSEYHAGEFSDLSRVPSSPFLRGSHPLGGGGFFLYSPTRGSVFIEQPAHDVKRGLDSYTRWLKKGNCPPEAGDRGAEEKGVGSVETGGGLPDRKTEGSLFASAWQWWSRQVTIEPEDLPQALVVTGMASTATLQGVWNFLAPVVSTAAQIAEAASGLLFIRVPEDLTPSQPDSA